MTDQARSAKSRRARFLVWYLLVGVGLCLMLPWEAWFGQQLFPFAFAPLSGEFRGEAVSISLSDWEEPNPQIPIYVHINMVDGVCRVAADGTTLFTMGAGSAGVDLAGVDTLVLDPGAGRGTYAVHLTNRWYQRVRVSRWVLASVMLCVLASVCAYYLIRWERQLRTGHGYSTRDARQRAVSVLDPIRMHLLGRRDPIPAELLAEMARDLVPGLQRGWRVWLWVSLIVMVGAFSLGLIHMGISGTPLSEYLYSLPGLLLGVIGLGATWYGYRMTRLRRVRDVLLKHLRCPHCGYDIRSLPTDPTDGATVCPECGYAWKLARKGNGG